MVMFHSRARSFHKKSDGSTTKSDGSTIKSDRSTCFAVSSANIFMAAVETESLTAATLSRSLGKDISIMSFLYKEEINSFIELANSFHPTIIYSRLKRTAKDLRKNPFSTCACTSDRQNFPVYKLHLLPPSKRQERLYQRRRLKTF